MVWLLDDWWADDSSGRSKDTDRYGSSAREDEKEEENERRKEEEEQKPRGSAFIETTFMQQVIWNGLLRFSEHTAKLQRSLTRVV